MAFRAGGADFAGVKTKKRARERALCVRQNWGHRAKSHFLPLLIRLARLSRTKPRGRAYIRRLRRPYAVQKKRFESDGSQPVKADSGLPSHLLRIMETARISNAPASAAGATLRSCALFSWHERGLGNYSAPGGDGAMKRRPRSAHHRPLSPPELRLLFLERPERMWRRTVGGLPRRDEKTRP